MRFQREKANFELFDEILPLLHDHYKEIAQFQDIPLEPAWDEYLGMEQHDMLRVYTARHEGELVGYAVYFVRRNPHYKGSLQATQDVLFIHPKNRGTGYKFLKWCDNQLKDDGVQVIYQHVKAKHNFGKLLERLGYGLVDLIYSRRV